MDSALGSSTSPTFQAHYITWEMGDPRIGRIPLPNPRSTVLELWIERWPECPAPRAGHPKQFVPFEKEVSPSEPPPSPNGETPTGVGPWTRQPLKCVRGSPRVVSQVTHHVPTAKPVLQANVGRIKCRALRCQRRTGDVTRRDASYRADTKRNTRGSHEGPKNATKRTNKCSHLCPTEDGFSVRVSSCEHLSWGHRGTLLVPSACRLTTYYLILNTNYCSY